MPSDTIKRNVAEVRAVADTDPERIAEAGRRAMQKHFGRGIILCTSNACPRKRDCAEWFGNNFHLPDDREYSHHDPYRPELGGCEWYREVEVKK